mgnify:CR=1 FL=1
MLQTPRNLARGRQQERKRPWRALPDDAELPVVHAREVPDVGQTVKPGQTLAVMDSADVLPAIAAQRAQVEAARTDEALQLAELKRVGDLRDMRARLAVV